MPTQQQYSELRHLLEKEAKAEIVKSFIRQNFPEPYVSMYCKQFDEARSYVDFLEYMIKQVRR